MLLTEEVVECEDEDEGRADVGGVGRTAVYSAFFAQAHLDGQVRAVGQGRLPGVRYHHRHVVIVFLQVL